MKNMTLRELCVELNISRRTVQGYEQQGLVSATGRTKRGYLLYDEVSRERIRLIHRYQQFGFHVKEIGPLLESSTEEQRTELEKKRRELLARKNRTEQLINIITEMIELL